MTPALPVGNRAAPSSIFADRFEFPDGWTHERCAKPSGRLTPHMHWGMTLPGDAGRATLDTYADEDEDRVYSRVVSFKTGEVAWFAVSRIPSATPAKAAVDVGALPLGSNERETEQQS